MPRHILGISCFYHDAAACLLRDGQVIAAASEERFTRKKHDPEFPSNAIAYCLKQAGITADQLDVVGFYDKPILKFERILCSAIATVPGSLSSFLRSVPVWLRRKLWVSDIIAKELGYKGKVVYVEHHLSHAASAFYPSPYDEAMVLTLDGVGEWATAAAGIGRGTELTILKEIHFPHSLGLLYSAFTAYLGFRVNSGEYKVMGAAPYGKPAFYDQVRRLIDVKEDGSFQLNMDYFAFDIGDKTINNHFENLFGGPGRVAESKLSQRDFDIAASIQKVTEEIVVKMARHWHKETGISNLCMAGGVALNCVANGKILRETPIKNIFVQPAAGDAGGSLGVALFAHHVLDKNDTRIPMQNAFWGPEFSKEDMRALLQDEGLAFETMQESASLDQTARWIAEGKVVGWYQGRMEFGPRALGNRSILGDARNPKMKDIINEKIKLREGFRPFAPAVKVEKVSEYFELDCASPYMLLVAPVRQEKRAMLPSVTHADGSARVQTVSRDENPRFYALIDRFEALTGVPVIINTSFNVRGEPMVCSPKEALNCFLRTDMDHLVLGDFVLSKSALGPLRIDDSWKKELVLD